MSLPFYVSPEQLMKDRAEFARKGIAKGRSVIVVSFKDGILLVADNPSHTLHKISEIYDRIAFAAVGRYNEFENLRIGGIRYADLRGFAYDRRDVNARGLANSYAQQLGNAFSSATDKPFEVELVVTQLGDEPNSDEIFQITYDGTISDQPGYAAIGGKAEQISEQLAEISWPELSQAEAIEQARAVLAKSVQLEIAILDRNSDRPRCFRRLERD